MITPSVVTAVTFCISVVESGDEEGRDEHSITPLPLPPPPHCSMTWLLFGNHRVASTYVVVIGCTKPN